MKLTRHQRVALAALGLATAALVADRTVLSPQTAVAQHADASGTAAVPLSPVKSIASPENLTANLRLVSTSRDTTTGDGRLLDPFAWQLPRAAVPTVTTEKSFGEVVSGWTLSSIVGTSDSRIAVINGHAVRVNESLAFSATDGRRAKVVEIREDSAVLYFDGQTLPVRLPTSTVSGVE